MQVIPMIVSAEIVKSQELNSKFLTGVKAQDYISGLESGLLLFD